MTTEPVLQEEKAIVQLRYQPVWLYILLCFVTFGLYNVYWFYKQWRFVKQHDGIDVIPFLRAWFGILFAHSLFDRLNDIAVEKGHVGILYNGYATGFVTLAILGNLLTRILPTPFDFLAALGIPAYLFVVPTLKQVNYIVKQTFPGRNDPTVTLVELILLIVGGLFVGLSLLGLLVED